ncbi:unnamed protein product [Miscanthus lutarioriparius]|uniref:Uncharacterized protein n=1 Tax=Miscanthus lutarioriparius TaxID=422564 RepID=A0A811R5V1_9POAL|nr:unnamed protein product [Miscanthus lutarioriparius]
MELAMALAPGGAKGGEWHHVVGIVIYCSHSAGKCKSYWFEEEYVVYLHDNGDLLAAGSTIAEALTTKVPKVVRKIDSLEKNLKKVKEIVGKNREGIRSCICLVCGCVNVTLFLVLAIFMVVAFLLK